MMNSEVMWRQMCAEMMTVQRRERLAHFFSVLAAVGYLADAATSIRFYQEQVEIALGG